MKILPNKITHRNRNTRRRGFILQCFTIRRIFRVADKGSEFFFAVQMTAGQSPQRMTSLNYEAGLTTFSVADNLFDQAIIKLNNFWNLNNSRRCFYNRYWLIYS